MPTAIFASKPKSRISIGVIRLPPPMPVMPTSTPTSRPASENCQVMRGRGGSGQETNGRPRSRQPSLYASQPVQKPVSAASSASAATRTPSATPSVAEAGGVRDRGGGEHDEPDHVRGARRARVLERPLAEARLDQLEVERGTAGRSAGRA